MRPLLSVLVGLAVVHCQFLVIAQSVSVPPGTGVEIELLLDISSETLKDGQTIPFKLVHALEINGETLLPAGSPAAGTVEKVKPSGKWGKSGAFNLTLHPLRLADGTIVAIDFPRPRRKSEKAERSGERTTAAVYYTYYFPLIPVALIAGARKGKPFNIRSGERYLVYVTATETHPASAAMESAK